MDPDTLVATKPVQKPVKLTAVRPPKKQPSSAKTSRALSRQARAKLVLPVSRMERILRQHSGKKRLSALASIAFTGAVEAILSDIMEDAVAMLPAKKKLCAQHVDRVLSMYMPATPGITTLVVNGHVRRTTAFGVERVKKALKPLEA